ncbi:Down syndrome cell adhesion molecule-like protein Dscam2 [Aethina tumida]|uniref:Down syndrome cell adhesion molecule-like protein Dscam2 n=1 Tax=Aethina tumida TaxID=116153 RepID=UPI002149430F|nr:Down syndrome cell adhesion molecule-like protein Dscam2 [Aethina tumida]
MIPIGTRTSLLTINAVQPEHAGVYTCVATNRGGKASHSAELLINVLPHITPFEFEGEVNTGDSVQLNCYVSKGDLPLNITWMLNGKPIETSWGISMIPIGTKTNLLTINSVQPEHAGVYNCVASNKGGTSTQQAELFINGT